MPQPEKTPSFSERLKAALNDESQFKGEDDETPSEEESLIQQRWDELMAVTQDENFIQAMRSYWTYKYSSPFNKNQFLKAYNKAYKTYYHPTSAAPNIEIRINAELFIILHTVDGICISHVGTNRDVRYRGSVEDFFAYMIDVIANRRYYEDDKEKQVVNLSLREHIQALVSWFLTM